MLLKVSSKPLSLELYLRSRCANWSRLDQEMGRVLVVRPVSCPAFNTWRRVKFDQEDGKVPLKPLKEMLS